MTFYHSLMYVGIVIVCGGPMFVACKRINIPPNVFIHLRNKTCNQQNYVTTNWEYFGYTRTLNQRTNMISQYFNFILQNTTNFNKTKISSNGLLFFFYRKPPLHTDQQRRTDCRVPGM